MLRLGLAIQGPIAIKYVFGRHCASPALSEISNEMRLEEKIRQVEKCGKQTISEWPETHQYTLAYAWFNEIVRDLHNEVQRARMRGTRLHLRGVASRIWVSSYQRTILCWISGSREACGTMEGASHSPHLPTYRLACLPTQPGAWEALAADERLHSMVPSERCTIQRLSACPYVRAQYLPQDCRLTSEIGRAKKHLVTSSPTMFADSH